jgi:molecular chaperone GrpE (heat shock protein)
MRTSSEPFGARLGRAWQVLRGATSPPSPAVQHDTAADLRGQVATLKADLAERDERIARLKREVEIVRQQGSAEQQAAADVALEGLARQLAPLLSQLDTMREMQAQGRELHAQDLLTLLDKLGKPWLEIGLLPIGTAGQTAAFDSTLHQRMSGGEVRPGTPVKVRFVGYRFRDKIVTKAMVSAEETNDGDRP